MADRVTKKQRSKIMASIKSSNTGLEKNFRKLLTRNKITGFRKGVKMFGNPDFISSKYKIAIFLDGDFWHGYNWKRLGRVPPKNYWQEKIERTITRDKKYTRILKSMGWKVIRIWEHELNSTPEKIIENLLFQKMKQKPAPKLTTANDD